MSMALNCICPYFTMFPLDFPLRVLSRHATRGEVVLDPFAGRGTTLYAGRLLGLRSYGIDSNPVAAAISESKLANTSPSRILKTAKTILQEVVYPQSIPEGEFWKLAFHPSVLKILCRLREGLLRDCRSSARKALRGLLLGALHGPRTKGEPSHFSNQCTRTYAPKPRYAAKYWSEHAFLPPKVDVLKIIEHRAIRYFGEERTKALGAVIQGDSTRPESFQSIGNGISWIVTSPPYYGMRTYLSDQWLRLWFIGGSSEVDYSNKDQLKHHSQSVFATDLQHVWMNCAKVAKPGCRLVIRFGAINDRHLEPLTLLKRSLTGTPWKIQTTKDAGSASSGKRQAEQFFSSEFMPIREVDVWAIS